MSTETCTGEELAESLDIAPPTLHKHLRIAERKVLSAIFDEPERD
ncbi:helix-turn-helix domain-containing protein [Haladaptatus sp. W1]